jgi:hypothetical protein
MRRRFLRKKMQNFHGLKLPSVSGGRGYNRILLSGYTVERNAGKMLKNAGKTREKSGKTCENE